MKDVKHGYLIYIAATVCFLLVVVFIVNDSPDVSPPPVRYVYGEDDTSSEQEAVNDMAETSNVVAEMDQAGSSAEKLPRKSSSQTPVKRYVSSSVSSSSQGTVSKQASSMPPSPASKVEQNQKPAKESSSKESSSKDVSSKEEKLPPDTTSMVNLNSASKEQLMTLDGIGEVISDRIIAFREQIGGFLSIDEITSVEGIGGKTFEKNKHRLIV